MACIARLVAPADVNTVSGASAPGQSKSPVLGALPAVHHASTRQLSGAQCGTQRNRRVLPSSPALHCMRFQHQSHSLYNHTEMYTLNSTPPLHLHPSVAAPAGLVPTTHKPRCSLCYCLRQAVDDERASLHSPTPNTAWSPSSWPLSPSVSAFWKKPSSVSVP